MRYPRSYFSAFVLLVVSVVNAQAAQRTFVSAGSGSDSNPCTRQLPCRNFAAAITQTDPGGEVVVLDSGGYGAVTINKSVSLISPLGVYAGITGFTGAALEINAGDAVVILKGLFLNGQGAATGILVTSALMVHVENVVIDGFSTGIHHGVVYSIGIFVRDSIIRHCDASGIVIAPTFGSSVLSIDGTRLERNGNGVLADSGVSVIVRDTVAAQSVGRGFWFRNAGSLSRLRATIENVTSSDSVFNEGFRAEGGAHVTIRNSAAVRNSSSGFWAVESTSVTELVVDGCLASENGTDGFVAGAGLGSGSAILTISNSTATNNVSNGIVAGLDGTVRASGNVVTRNGTGLSGTEGNFESAGDNVVRGNTTETVGSITIIPTT